MNCYHPYIELIHKDEGKNLMHPYSTIYVEFTPEQRADMGIRPTMMRLSASIEGVGSITSMHYGCHP